MNSKAFIKFETEEEVEYFNRNVKEEPLDQSEDCFEYKHEISAKAEPVDADCISEPALYVDHQIKLEMDIGPTEFLKQDTGTLNTVVSSKTSYHCAICSKTFKYKIALNKHKHLEHNNNTQKHNKNTVVVSHFFHQAKNKKNKKFSKLKKLMKNDKNEFESITCGVCFKHFKSLKYLRNHMKKCPMLIQKSCQTNEPKPNSQKSVVMKNEVIEKIVVKNEKVNKDFKKRADSIEKFVIIKEKTENFLEIQDYNDSNNKKEENYTNDLKEEEKYDNTNSDDKIDKKSKEKCPKCLKTFTLKNNLRRHLKNVHSTNEHKKYCCDQCDKSFNRTDYLIKHKLYKHSQVNNNEFKCKCGTKFHDNNRLKRHTKYYCKLNQKQEEILICDQCDRRFPNKVVLNEHLKRHANAKILICDFCEEILPQKYLLIRHIQHHMELPEVMYNCEICGKKFVRSFSLKKHLISHTGKKPFFCKFCGRGFRSRWGCLSHEKQLCQIMDEINNQH